MNHPDYIRDVQILELSREERQALGLDKSAHSGTSVLRPLSEIQGIEGATILTIVHGYIAADAPILRQQPVGAYLVRTKGYAKGGGRNYVVVTTYDSQSPDYRKKKFRADSDAEAIQKANAILSRWSR